MFAIIRTFVGSCLMLDLTLKNCDLVIVYEFVLLTSYHNLIIFIVSYSFLHVLLGTYVTFKSIIGNCLICCLALLTFHDYKDVCLDLI